jgi:hypothetical protein
MTRLGTAALALLAIGGASTVAMWVGGARAQEPGAGQAAKPFRCHVFKIDTEAAVTWETTDRTTEIGQWVGEQEDAGWALHHVDFEVGQKATGYPQGYVQICMQPA